MKAKQDVEVVWFVNVAKLLCCVGVRTLSESLLICPFGHIYVDDIYLFG